MKKDRKKVLITIWGAWYSSKNVGDQAILIGITGLIKKCIPTARFFVPCSNPEFVRQEHGFCSWSPRRRLVKVLLTLARSDLFIIGGGTPFYDNYKHMLYCAVLVLVAKLFRTPIMVYAVSSQEIKSRLTGCLTKFVLNNANIVSVRESLTAERMRGLGFRKEINVTADPAVSVSAISTQELEKIFKEENLNNLQKPLIGICPHFFSVEDSYRVHHYRRFPDEVIQNYKKVMAQIADYVTSIGTAIFIPMHALMPDSDLELSIEILKMMKYASKVKLIARQYRPREICGIFSRLDLVIGVRLHSLVMAATANTPVISVSYAPKVKGFINLLEQYQYMLELESLSFENLKGKVEDALLNRESIKAKLKIRIQQLQQQAEKNALRAASLLGASFS